MPKKRKITLCRIPANTNAPFINKRGYYLERDILRVAGAIFNIERLLKEGYPLSDNYEIEISKETYESIDRDKMKLDIESLMAFVLYTQVNIKIIPIDDKRYRRIEEYTFPQNDTICLFSGGIDSLSGLLNAKSVFGQAIGGVFVAHNDQTWIISIVEKLMKELHESEHVSIDRIDAPGMGSTGYSQLRGFLYCLCGGIYAKLKNSKRIIISECGPTMYQVRFSPFDTITMTTHPFVLKKAKAVLENFLQRKIEFVLPFENLTKGEVARIGIRYDLFPQTHSCISQRFGKNDGVCYGCITRRLGLLAANTPDAKYVANPLVNENSNSDQVLTLLRFSSDILIDYGNLQEYSKENIETYNKYDLFRRFALDNFLGIRKIPKDRLNPQLSRIISDTEKLIDKKELSDRDDVLKNARFKPDFTKTV